jgi:glycerophosphoryl diester phosphodiesterase
MSGLDWLTARPVAHRGLHDGLTAIENTTSAFQAAIDGGYAIETDVQITADGEAMVHHDFALGRLTLGSRQLAAMTAPGLKDVPFKATADRMMTLGELCEFVAGRVPLVVELKSRFDGNLKLVRRAAEVVKAYAGPAALMSFDPTPIAALREIAPDVPRGIVAERHYGHSEWHEPTPLRSVQWRSCCTCLVPVPTSSLTASKICPRLARGLLATLSAAPSWPGRCAPRRIGSARRGGRTR